jgi:uncharacterized LabA/DUF88 family protein
MEEQKSKANKERALVLIDKSNYHYGLKKLGWNIDYQKLYNWLCDIYDLTEICIYEGIHTEKSFFITHSSYDSYEESVKDQAFKQTIKKKRSFHKKIKNFGYKVYAKPIQSIYDDTDGEYKLKCNCDVEITIKAISKVNEYDRLILCSGDGDFAKLCRYLKGQHNKKITVLSIRSRTSYLIRKAANKVIFLNSIRDKIEFSPGVENDL